MQGRKDVESSEPDNWFDELTQQTERICHQRIEQDREDDEREPKQSQ
jgi:hypothetical protein